MLKKLALTSLLAAAALSAWQYRTDIKSLLQRSPRLSELVQNGTLVDSLAREILAPPPLRFDGAYRNTVLTRAGVITATNKYRSDNGLPELSENGRLNQAASDKVSDMFAGQYFEHISPQGAGPSDLADAVAYHYVVIGENLALGNFEGDSDLVTAWMGSPGHRENILHERFTEIGVSVKRGTFEGKTVWLAVQEFGRPATDCPAISDVLKTSIDTRQSELDRLENQLDAQRSAIESSNPKTQEEYQEHNRKVAEYNSNVRYYNEQLATVKNMVAEYNTQVRSFNSCVSD